ncbi:carbohydrate sulfotransferase 13-like [Diadema setosum]|uniref:carbohydrate sulfotransferase 13-like n=1 Tax=Diadema setosum TaxID=31175 RepID=UPI003B3BB1EA
MPSGKQWAATGLVVLVVAINVSVFMPTVLKPTTLVFYAEDESHSDVTDEDTVTTIYPNESSCHDNMKKSHDCATGSHVQANRLFADARSSTLHDDDLYSVQEFIQAERRAHLRATCQQYGLNGSVNDLMQEDLSRFIVDEKYKLIYCSVPKIASTSWKRVLLVLRGVMDDPYDLSQPIVNNKVAPKKLKYLSFYKRADAERMLQDYVKFIVVRDPFSRLLSAFRNKLEPNSTFERAYKFQERAGASIQRRYKSKRTKPSPAAKKIRTPQGTLLYDLTFSNFVKFLIDPKPGPMQIWQENRHWARVSKQCYPCLTDFDIIAKFETLSDDAAYILHRTDADSVVQFPSQKGSSPTNSSSKQIIESYFATVPRNYESALYKKYNLDFELFGYNKPKRIS